MYEPVGGQPAVKTRSQMDECCLKSKEYLKRENAIFKHIKHNVTQSTLL